MKKIFYNVGRIFTLAFITTMLTIAPSAKAGIWGFNDFLSPSSIAKWSCWATGDSYLSHCTYHPGTHVFNDRWSPVSLTDSVELTVGSGWSDLGRPVSITPFYPGTTTRCTARMTVLPGVDYTLIAQLEVIDAASWTYVKTKRVEYRTPTKSVIVTPSWVPTSKDIFVRIGIIGGAEYSWLYVGDMTVMCS
ncbi:MAG: hypothetical protein V4732_22000 [Pseudomonadota bacterium]